MEIVCAAGSLCSSVGTAMHHKFKAFESSTYAHDGRVFGIHYGSGHLLGVMAKEQLEVIKKLMMFALFDSHAFL